MVLWAINGVARRRRYGSSSACYIQPSVLGEVFMPTDQFGTLLEVLDHHTVALAIAAAAGALTAAAAIYALIFARRQIFAAQAGIRATVMGTKATMIYDLDRRWEGEMLGVRAKWTAMRDHITEVVEKKYGNRPLPERHAKMGEECSVYLHDLRSSAPLEYNSIISVIGFFETVGYSVDRNFLSADEIIDLYGESIREFDRLCWDHMQKRIDESKRSSVTGTTKVWEHACNLVLHIRNMDAALRRAHHGT
jgi:hypothetical protein